MAIITASMSYSKHDDRVTFELKPGEIILGIIIRLNIIRLPPGRHPILRIGTQIPNLIDPINILALLIPIVTKNNPLPHRSFNQLVQQQQHDPKQIKCLAD
jgi:hypothetical protein